jgi:hypothetical protein
MALMLLLFPFQIIMSRTIRAVRAHSLRLTDQRVRLVGQLLQGIRAVKLQAWEEPVATVLSAVRKKELRYVRISGALKATNELVIFVWYVTTSIPSHFLQSKKN